MKKKILAMLLAAGMLVGLLAGCGGGTTESAKTSESETPASTQAEAPVTEEQSAAPAQEPASLKRIGAIPMPPPMPTI